KRLSVISLSQLKTLRCANAALTALFLPRSSSLETLDCSKNQLTALNLNGCETLNSLNCAENQLPELSLSGLSALQELDCHGNQLTSLDLSGRQLTRLDRNRNQLTSLDVSKQLSLEELSCGENQLIALDVTGLSQLQTLSADGNRRNVPVNAVCQLDLTTLADGFAPEFAAEDSWQNAVCDGTLLTVTDISAEVQYDYCIDANDLERTVRFTLVPQAMEEDSCD
ncbi:MAG: leucine-rich repeat domain-containing protein, partial [Ruminococcus sp.]